jgi:hypothetical protein
MSRWLQAIGLHRRELRAWAMYDWGISGMQTIIMTAVFPIFFVKVAAAGMEAERASAWWGYVNTIGAVLIAVLAPILGALADFKAAKKKFLVAFMLLGAGATAAMFFVQRGDMVLASITFILSLAGATGSMTFYEALLPHIADESEIDRVSTAGYALGYVGGGLLLAIALAVIQKPGLIGLPSGAIELHRRRGVVGGVRDSSAAHRGRAAAVAGAGRSHGGSTDPCVDPPAGHHVARAAQLQAGVPDDARLHHLQRWDPDHHQDGQRLRH